MSELALRSKPPAGVPPPPGSALAEFLWRTLLLLALLGAALLVWYTGRVFLLAFGGILLAVFLDFLAGQLAAVAAVRRGWAFAIVAVGISLLLALAGWEAVPRIADQVSQFIHLLPASLEHLQNSLKGSQWGQTLLSYLPNMLASANITATISTLLQRSFEGLAGLVVIAVVGLYVGANPHLYHRGLLRLFPGERRERVRDVLGEVAYTLRWWVIGQLVPMGALGIASMIALLLLHVRLAFTLGLFTGFMIFIPYVGSLIAFVVTALVASLQGPQTVLYVLLVFLGIHVAEGYVLTPMIQRRAVYLPAGLIILAQVLMGLLIGFLGLALATPLTAAALVLVKMLYLHERPRHHGS